MRVLLFGATGMIGRGVLRECLLDDGVEAVVTIGRTGTGVANPKLREIVREDLFDYAGLEGELSGFDACFFCLGVSASQVSAVVYERLTYGLTVAAAEALRRWNPSMTFIYVSGMGTDGTEKGPVAWARVKGRTENAVLGMGFRAAYAFRPAGVIGVHGEVSRVPLYRVLYFLLRPLLPLWERLFPRYLVTTEAFGRAMIRAAREGAAKRVLENWDIRELGK